MNSYELSRLWFDFAFDNPSKITPAHGILYFFCIEHCNRLGWKKEFGLPTTMAKEAIGIRSYNTYINTLNDLVEWGFIILIEKSKNQYSSNIIALSNFNKAHDKALDKAMLKHVTKQCESTIQSISSIDKQINNITINQEQDIEDRQGEFSGPSVIFTSPEIELGKEKNVAPKKETFSFKNALLFFVNDEQVVNDYMEVRKKKKGANTETAFNLLMDKINESNMTPIDCIKKCIDRNWLSFDIEWINKHSFNNSKPPEKDNLTKLLEASEGAKSIVNDYFDNKERNQKQ